MKRMAVSYTHLMAGKTAREAFGIPKDEEKIILKGIVSRKKQFLPTFVEALHN